MDTGSTPTDGGGAKKGAAAGPLDKLAQLLQAIDNQLKTVDARITTEVQQLTTAKTTLDRDNTMKTDLATQRSALQRLMDGAKSDGQKIDAQRQSASADLQDICNKLAQIQADLAARIDKNRRKVIDDAVAKVDASTQTLTDDVTQKQKVVDDAEVALKKAKADVTAAGDTLKQAQNKLSGLAAQIQAALVQAKKVAVALQQSYDRGQVEDAYLITKDVDAAVHQLEMLLDPGYETKLQQDIDDAVTALQNANQAVADVEKDKSITQMKAELAAAQKALQDYQASRRKHIDENLPKPSDGKTGGSDAGESTDSTEPKTAEPAKPGAD